MRRRITLDIRSAAREIASKTDAEIERETAVKWAARAVACYREYARSGDARLLIQADGYRHEAVEHAATVSDYGRTAGTVQRQIDKEIKLLGLKEAVELKRVKSRRRRRR